MASASARTKIIYALLALSLVLVWGCSRMNSIISPSGSSRSQGASASINKQGTLINTDAASVSTNAVSNSIVYKNTKYGFSFTLPASWQGYTIIPGTWEGVDLSSGKVSETGPIISIRHPLWTSKRPRQDIPIMVFTIKQWNLLQKEKFHVGAAPINPSELARNNKYVFALPARYNYAFPIGFQEVEEILRSHPLKATHIGLEK